MYAVISPLHSQRCGPLTLLLLGPKKSCPSTPSAQPRRGLPAPRQSLLSRKATPTWSQGPFGEPELPPLLDLLGPRHQQPGHHDLSGVRHPLCTRTRSHASVDAFVSSTTNTTPTHVPWPAQRFRSKSKVSTSLTQKSAELTPQRQLMKPIAPPLLQGQATGSQSSFVVGGAAEIQSPLKRPSYPVRSGGKGELGDMGFTPCSRMRDFNVEVCGLANEQRQV